MARVVSLLTDFGTQDSYVAEVKAVLLGIPGVTLVDITHEVPPYDIRQGAFQLLRAYAHFPKGTTHLVVVDPGVGSTRRGVFIKTKRFQFVGPDNGVLRWAVEDCEQKEGKKAQVFEIPTVKELLPTFHGRDFFAPFVVRLSKGKPGKLHKMDSLSGDTFPKCLREGDRSHGQVVAIDRYGNAVTSIPFEDCTKGEGHVGGTRLASSANYSEIENGTAALIRGSHGFWEISSRQRSAAELLGLEVGTKVSVTSSSTTGVTRI